MALLVGKVDVVLWLEPRPAQQQSQVLAPSVPSFPCKMPCLFTDMRHRKNTQKAVCFLQTLPAAGWIKMML